MTVAYETLEQVRNLNLRSLVHPFELVSGLWAQNGEQKTAVESLGAAFDDTALLGGLAASGVNEATEDLTKPAGKVYTARELRGLRAELVTLFTEAQEEAFEDGVESAFSKRLRVALEVHDDMAMNQVILLVEENRIAPEVLAETLRWLGQVEESVAYSRRRWLLERCLEHPSVTVRDGAILGLSFLEDPRVIPTLEHALRREEHATLRADIEQVLADLSDLRPDNQTFTTAQA